jgi:hypothetical protein
MDEDRDLDDLVILALLASLISKFVFFETSLPPGSGFRHLSILLPLLILKTHKGRSPNLHQTEHGLENSINP